MKRISLIPIIFLLVVNGLVKSNAEEVEISSVNAKQIIQMRAQEVIRVLKNKDLKHLSRLVHPNKGICLSPFPYVKPGTKGFGRKQISNFSFSDHKVFVSVPLGESGFDKNYRFSEYFDRFIYDKDFESAPEENFNKDIHRGSAVTNLFEVFPGAIIVEYHFSGFDPQYGGNDWKSLLLVFEKADDSKWYLVDIAHNEWSS
jgi:hypothetical protein